MMFIMEIKSTFKVVELPQTLLPQPMPVGGGGAALHIKGEVR
jgi:hypothetical protein